MRLKFLNINHEQKLKLKIQILRGLLPHHELGAAAVGTDGDQVDHHQQHDQAHQENEATKKNYLICFLFSFSLYFFLLSQIRDKECKLEFYYFVGQLTKVKLFGFSSKDTYLLLK